MAAGRRRRRPHVIPPAPDWPRTEAVVLAELEETAIGLELWHAARHVRLWLETAPRRRSRLFHRTPHPRTLERREVARDEAPELEKALTVLAELTASPQTVRPRRVAQACAEIAEWAAARSCSGAAALFAAAAASLLPANPQHANLAALMYRRAGDWTRAELFYERGIGYARRQGNAAEYIGGHIGRAALFYGQGLFERARRNLLRAAAAAHRSGRHWLAGHAHHDLMLILAERGDCAEAEVEARRAVHLYPLHDRRLPFLVADFALVQILQHRHAEAIPLLRRFLEVVEEPAARAVVMGMLARCFAGTGRQEQFRRLVPEALELAGRHREHAAAAFYHLAEGARACAAWDEARAYALQARDLALARGDREIVRRADGLVGEISARRFALPPARVAGAGESSRPLCRVLAARLARWNVRNRRGRKRSPVRDQWVA